MSDQIQVLIAFSLYLILFAWIGFQRGTLREFIILVLSIGGYFGLERYQSVIVRVINLFSRFISFARAGGLTSDDPNAILKLRDAPGLIQPGDEGTAIFVIWALLLFLGYVVTSQAISDSQSKPSIYSLLLGVANGLFYITVFLPRLVALILPDTELSQELAAASFRKVLTTTWDVLGENFQDIWAVVEPQRSLIFLLLITGLVVLAATTLNGARAKS
jgi:hypothetical protein